jgi:uncharacterized protein (TIGR03067 family)
MKLQYLALMVGFASTAICGSAGDPQAPQERQKLAGTWKGFVVEGRGESPDRGPVKLELKVTEQAMAGHEFKGTNLVDHGHGEYTIDTSQSPWVLDAWQTNELGRKQNFIGIYKLEADTLQWCVSPRKVRPTEFRSGDGSFLLILKRQKAVESSAK